MECDRANSLVAFCFAALRKQVLATGTFDCYDMMRIKFRTKSYYKQHAK